MDSQFIRTIALLTLIENTTILHATELPLNMRFTSSLFLALSAIGRLAVAMDTLDYSGSIHALSYGNVETQGDATGTVWLNVSKFAADKLPNIQNDVGLYTLDNALALKSIAGLAAVAAQQQKWGDIVYLYNAFSMNGHVDYTTANSTEMRHGLLIAVLKADKSGVDPNLINLYIKTSSSPYLVEAFNSLYTTPVESLTKRWLREVCDGAHKAAVSACRNLAENIRFNATVKVGGPRNICKGGCCISWSANATFRLQNLYPAANYCVNACGSAGVSCEVFGVELQGTYLDQCLSNRAGGCE